MIKLGLSGNMYSGTDQVAKIFKGISIPVFDADILVKFLLHYNFEISHNIRIGLGSKYFLSTDLDFSAVKRDGKFDSVVDIIETEVFSAFKKFQVKNANAVYVIFKSSILFESGWYKKMDKNLFVSAEESIRINNCKQKTGLDYQKIKDLISSEMKQKDKISLSQLTIINTGLETKLLDSVNMIDMKLIDEYISTERSNRIFTL